MDHVLEKIEQYYEIYLDDFINEHVREGHKKLSDNSHYKEVQTLIESMNPIRKLLGWPPLRLIDEVKNLTKKVGENNEH
jgi:hypothetical protein